MDDVLEKWSQAAETYWRTQMRNQDAIHNFQIVQARFSAFSGEKILDVGCGYGLYTDYFRRIGARVVGCDGAPAMLKRAGGEYPDCCFDCVDLLEKLPYGDDEFDLLFCNQVLMDIPEIQGLFQEFNRILRPGGILYISIVHPMAYPGTWVEDEAGNKTGKCIRDYAKVYSVLHKFCGETVHFHRPVSYYMNQAVKNGFLLTDMQEPDRGDAGMPLFLFMEFQKGK